jgi:hypothetical protein
MNPEILNENVPSPFDSQKSPQQQEEMPVIVVHISKDEIKSLDDLQGGASFDEETGVREYKGIAKIFQETPELAEIFVAAGKDITDNGKLDNPDFKTIYEEAKKRLPNYQESPADYNPEIEKAAELGEGGDTELVIFPTMLADLLDEIRGERKINPRTGLREYSWKNLKNSFLRVAATVAGGIAGAYAGQPGVGAALGNLAGRMATGQSAGSAFLPAAKNYGYTMAAQGAAGLANSAFPGMAESVKNVAGTGFFGNAAGKFLNQGQGMGFLGNTTGSQSGWGGALGSDYGGLGGLLGVGGSNSASASNPTPQSAVGAGNASAAAAESGRTGFMKSPLMSVLSSPATLMLASTALQMKGQKDERREMEKINRQGSQAFKQAATDPNMTRSLPGPTWIQRVVYKRGPDGQMYPATEAVPVYPGQPAPINQQLPPPDADPNAEASPAFRSGGRVKRARGGSSGAPSREYGYYDSGSSGDSHSAANNAAMNSYLASLDSGGGSSGDASGYGNSPYTSADKQALSSHIHELASRPDWGHHGTASTPHSTPSTWQSQLGAVAPLLGGVLGGPIGALAGSGVGAFLRPPTTGQMAMDKVVDTFIPGMGGLVNEFGPSFSQIKDVLTGNIEGIPFQKDAGGSRDDASGYGNAPQGHSRASEEKRFKMDKESVNPSRTRGRSLPGPSWIQRVVYKRGPDGQMYPATEAVPVYPGQPAPINQQLPPFKRGGRVNNGMNPMHGNQAGYIGGPGKGQDDKIPKDVPEGSYIIDASSVSMFGDGSSRAGKDELDRAVALIRKKMPIPAHKLARGGNIGKRMIPAMLSDGEYEIDPMTVTAIGGGSNKKGAKFLKSAVKQLRQHKNSNGDRLPPRAKDLISYLKGAS